MSMAVLWGWGGGLANGLGGPVAPAESMAVADGDGGGRMGASAPLRRTG